jgi:hypothetical protein
VGFKEHKNARGPKWVEYIVDTIKKEEGKRREHHSSQASSKSSWLC